MNRLVAICFLSLLGAQVRIEARLEDPSQKTTLQVEAQLTPQYLRWLYKGTWGGRELPLMDILTRPEGNYLLDHQKRISFLIRPDPPRIQANSTPQPLRTESYLSYTAQWYRLKLSDGSELNFLWTKEVSFDWGPWKAHLRDPILAAILEAGFDNGMPLSWSHRSAQGTLLSQWRIERITPLQPNPLEGVLPYEPIPLENAVETHLQKK